MAKVKTTVDGAKIFKCPGCDDYHTMIVTGELHRKWGFNGDHEKPTFTPSILASYNWDEGEKEVCHSFVTDGKIQFLGDCTHAHANETLEIPEWPHAPGAFGGIIEEQSNDK